jgi:hypothetical protein
MTSSTFVAGNCWAATASRSRGFVRVRMLPSKRPTSPGCAICPALVLRPPAPERAQSELKVWIVHAGFDSTDYSIESLRRTKALHILKGTGNLQTVRALLGKCANRDHSETSRSQNKSRSDSSLASIRYLTVSLIHRPMPTDGRLSGGGTCFNTGRQGMNWRSVVWPLLSGRGTASPAAAQCDSLLTPVRPPRLRLRPRQQGTRHPGDPGMARESVDHRYGGLHGLGTEPVQGLLECHPSCKPLCRAPSGLSIPSRLFTNQATATLQTMQARRVPINRMLAMSVAFDAASSEGIARPPKGKSDVPSILMGPCINFV